MTTMPAVITLMDVNGSLIRCYSLFLNRQHTELSTPVPHGDAVINMHTKIIKIIFL